MKCTLDSLEIVIRSDFTSRAKLGVSVVVMEAAAGGEKICRKKDGKLWKCKNVSGDNKLDYCDKHFKDFTDFYTENPSLITANKSKCLPKKKMEEIELLKKNKLPLPDEHLCRLNTGSWRCKNLRMGHGDDDHSVRKSTYCQKHCNYYASLYTKQKLHKKRNRDDEATDPIETRDSNCSKMRKKVIEEYYPSLGIQPAACDDIPDIQGGSANVATKGKNVERTESGELHFTDLMQKEMEKKKMPPDVQYCCHTNGKRRCKNFRMSHGAAADDPGVPKTKFCEKHYNAYAKYHKKKYPKKKKSGDGEGEGAGCSTATGPVEETKGSKPGEKVTEEVDEAEIQKPRATGDNTSDRIGRKRENVGRAEESGQLESLAGIGENVVELESLEHYKSKCFELYVELENKKVECTTLQSKLAKVEETRKTSVEDGNRTPTDATECWRKLFSDMAGCVQSHISDLESMVLRMENKISTLVGCVESLKRSGKGNSILRCVELRDSEKIESEAQGSQNDVTRSSEEQIDENNRTRPNVETSSGGRKDSHVSSSPDHMEISMHPFVNLVSDDDSVEILGESEDSDNSTDSEGSLGTLMDMLASKYRNRNEDNEIKWKIETDMLSSFEEDPELYLKAVCALYRQQISEGEMSDKGLLNNSDALRCATLAKFLMDEHCKGDLKKSVKELETFDPKAVDDCKRLARRYSMQLFGIYQDGKDPYFLPSTTASRGDETAR